MLQWLPFIAGLMPLIAMFGAFALGVAYEVLPDCNPIIDGCRSISATGRQPPGSFLFRAIMLPNILSWPSSGISQCDGSGPCPLVSPVQTVSLSW